MSKYPSVNYIGNKEKVAEWIIESLPIKQGTVLDLFCGGCSVSYALKRRGFRVIANDALFSNFVLAKAIIENYDINLDQNDYESIKLNSKTIEKKYVEIEGYFTNKLYFEQEVLELAKLSLMAKKLNGYKKYIFMALLRRAMIRKIPYSRMNIKWEEIQKLRDEEYSYKKYGRYRHYHNISFIEHIEQNIEDYNHAVFETDLFSEAMNCDALDCVKKIMEKIDVIYMDPPYPSTMNKYDQFYGAFDLLFDRNTKIKLDLTNKETFLINFTRIIKACVGKTKYIAISLNNNCYPNVEILLYNISKYIKSYVIKEKEHAYKVTNKNNKHNNYEVLLICELKEK